MHTNSQNHISLIRKRLGKLPSDWTVVQIDDIARLNQRSLPESTNDDFAFRYLDVAAVREGNVDVPDSTICFRDAPSRARRLPKTGDILMSMVRPQLRGFARIRSSAEALVCSTGFAVISATDPLDAEFLYQSLYSQAVARQLHGLVVGSGYPAVNSTDVGQLCIVFPLDPAERRRIGSALQAWEAALGHLSSLHERKRRLRDELARSLLSGELRLPGFTTPWVQQCIGALTEIADRHVTVQQDVEYRLISVRRRSGGLFFRPARKGKDIGYSRLKTVSSGDFLIARRQVVHGAMAMVTPKYAGTFVSDSYAVLTARDGKLHMPFFDQLSRTKLMYHKALRCSYGVAVEKLFFNLKWFLNNSSPRA